MKLAGFPANEAGIAGRGVEVCVFDEEFFRPDILVPPEIQDAF
jgi:hypothetical protein